MHIEFLGRGVHIQTEHGAIALFPDEVFQLVSWAKQHEFALIGKAREMQLIEEEKRRAEQQKGDRHATTD